MKRTDAQTRAQGDPERQGMGDGEMGRKGDMVETRSAIIAEELGQATLANPGDFLTGLMTASLKAFQATRRFIQSEQLRVRKGGLPPRFRNRTIAKQMAPLPTILLFLATAAGQQIGNPTTQQGVTPPRGTYVIRNARVITLSGADIENGTIVIRDGKIDAVGANVSVPSGAQSIDARGLSVYPGMMDAGTALGLVEVGQGATGTVDTTEVGDLNPNAKAIMAINPHSAHIAVTRVDGVTSAVSLPAGGLISGQAAIINLVGATPQEMAVVPYAALVINFPR